VTRARPSSRRGEPGASVAVRVLGKRDIDRGLARNFGLTNVLGELALNSATGNYSLGVLASDGI
jgi:hypothetical protein